MTATEDQAVEAKESKTLMTFDGLVRATTKFMRQNEHVSGFPLTRIEVAVVHVMRDLDADGIQEVDIERGSRKAVADLGSSYERLSMPIPERVARMATRQMGTELEELIDNRNSAFRQARPELAY